MEPPQRRGRWPQIYWLGPGSNPDGLHSKKAFLKIMHNTYPEVVYWRCRGDVGVPAGKLKKNNITGWINFAGAQLI
jgi:hypothetical protein